MLDKSFWAKLQLELTTLEEGESDTGKTAITNDTNSFKKTKHNTYNLRITF